MTEIIPTLTTADEAKAELVRLGETHDWVSVFWDRRDRSVPEISIIVDGNGQKPLAYLTREVYSALVDSRTVGPDTLKTFHPRRLHDYRTPPEPEAKGPSVLDVCEQVVRSVIEDHSGRPLQGQFYRGLGPGKTPEIQYDYVETAQIVGGFVRIAPHASEVAVLAMRVAFLCPDLVGEYRALPYPMSGGAVDLGALVSPEWRAELAALVEAQLVAVSAQV